MKYRLAQLAALLSLTSLAFADPAATGERSILLYGFEQPDPAWRAVTNGDTPGAVCALSETAVEGAHSLRIDAAFPGTAGAAIVIWEPVPDPGDAPAATHQVTRTETFRKTRVAIGRESSDMERARWGRWEMFSHLALQVYVPRDAPRDVQVLVCLKGTELDYYQHFRPAPLPRGRWTRLTLDLTAASKDWKPADHHKPWDGYCRQDVNYLAVKFVSKSPYRGPLLVDDVALLSRPNVVPDAGTVFNLRVNGTNIGRYEKFEISFNLDRTYSNPFDPEVVDVSGQFVCPDGTTESVPGFFYQGYQRRRVAGAEKLVPMGRSQWKIRYAPRQLGRYHYYVTVEDGETVRTDTATFLCVESDEHGFVRMSPRDPAYFEFDDGTFYYPIGHNIASARDTRAEKMGVYVSAAEGTFAFDRFLSKMGAHGENFGRVWMSPWSFEIEWTKDYNSHFAGLGRYSLHNAWRLDHVVEAARRQGVYLMLLMASHGEITDHESNFQGSKDSSGKSRPEWGSPYWSANGGPIGATNDFYTDATVLKLYERQARYIAARWGYSTAIMAWEILNEPDLHSAFGPRARTAPEFGRNCARFTRELMIEFRRHDPARHLLTTGLWQDLADHTLPVLTIPEMDFFAAHVFSAALPQHLRERYDQIKARSGKIVFVTEADFSPFPRGADVTLRSMRVPLWSSFMMPHPGAATPWWWVLIDQKDAYCDFQALAAFAEGEDRRGQNYRSLSAAVTDKAPRGAGRRLMVECMGNARRAFCWVYNTRAFSQQSSWVVEQPHAATLSVPGMQDGAYIVEVWDTSKGVVIDSLQVTARGGTVTFGLPPFGQDIACKVIRTAETALPRNAPRVRPPEHEPTLPD